MTTEIIEHITLKEIYPRHVSPKRTLLVSYFIFRACAMTRQYLRRKLIGALVYMQGTLDALPAVN